MGYEELGRVAGQQRWAAMRDEARDRARYRALRSAQGKGGAPVAGAHVGAAMRLARGLGAALWSLPR